MGLISGVAVAFVTGFLMMWLNDDNNFGGA